MVGSAASSVGCETAVGLGCSLAWVGATAGSVDGVDAGFAPPHADSADRTSAAISKTIQNLFIVYLPSGRKVYKNHPGERKGLTIEKRFF
jgi:hypothetical protein